MHLRTFLAAVILCPLCALVAKADPDPAPVVQWLEGQKKIKSAQASFLQERYLSRVNKPLKSGGVFFFEQPRKFRWEVGNPARTIIVADASETLTILDNKKTEAATYTLEDVREGRAPAAAGFLAGGIPESWDEINRVLRVREIKTDAAGKLSQVSFSMRDNKAAAFVLMVTFEIDPASAMLQRVTLNMRDGSRYVTTFSNQQTGVRLNPELFKADTTGYTKKNS